MSTFLGIFKKKGVLLKQVAARLESIYLENFFKIAYGFDN
ncbi:hypothetical protein NSTCB13_07424 [Nostoc sp. DSM 114160]|jgi:hypothetical protein